MKISSIADSINPLTLKDNINLDNKKDSTFSNMLNDAVSEVNKEQMQGYKAMDEIASGKVTNLQHAVQQIEEAELSMKLGLEVKNKALNAYKEVMRMQI
ncbi:flagellar hook-basal body complex protein FliE [Arcobacter roscoffensis]|uniref:Flagellar hook-basal body complex protein FliE n=1 Tax=Arcobacter roscoffensis TaxID=2961520 RepID=A0ABY5E4B3_9BACT|nr:flagellar hook-basal body complex protein FliE [Arcobacter roscoffensis]UTJ05968.1 flagellar hook-basal body complex protein FliE [Arcobacter roscoffensis]